MHKIKYQIPNIDSLKDSITQKSTKINYSFTAYFASLDLQCAYIQLK